MIHWIIGVAFLVLFYTWYSTVLRRRKWGYCHVYLHASLMHHVGIQLRHSSGIQNPRTLAACDTTSEFWPQYLPITDIVPTEVCISKYECLCKKGKRMPRWPAKSASHLSLPFFVLVPSPDGWTRIRKSTTYLTWQAEPILFLINCTPFQLSLYHHHDIMSEAFGSKFYFISRLCSSPSLSNFRVLLLSWECIGWAEMQEFRDKWRQLARKKQG